MAIGIIYMVGSVRHSCSNFQGISFQVNGVARIGNGRWGRRVRGYRNLDQRAIRARGFGFPSRRSPGGPAGTFEIKRVCTVAAVK